MHARAALLQPANHLQEILKRQIRVQTADDVEFQCAFAGSLFGAGVNFFQRKIVCARRVGVAAKRAQFAVSDANICRIDVPVDIEIGDVAVSFLANVIREPANGEQVRRTIQADAVVKRKTLAGENFLRNRLQLQVGDREFAHSKSVESFKRAKPQPRRPRTAETIY